MSSPPEPANNPKPVVKDKNPHNYRKVGYSMIVISVSLVAIGLLVWAIGDDYHFSTNIMAAQEVDAMTPKSGYNIVLFDASQPVGAKLKLLDEADSIDAAQALKTQDAKQNVGNTLQVLIFNSTSSYNTKLMADSEVYLMTPKSGYNVVLFNDPLPVGQKLTLGIHEEELANATDYQKSQQENLQGQDIQVLIFTSNFRDDLKMVTGSRTPVGDYANIVYNMTNQTAQQPETQAAKSGTNETNPTNTLNPPVSTSNNTGSQTTNQSSISGNQTVSHNTVAVIPSNQTMSHGTNNTKALNQTGISEPNMTSNASNHTAAQKSNETNMESEKINATATTKVSKSVVISEKVGINATGK